jgi:hypothetical protein
MSAAFALVHAVQSEQRASELWRRPQPAQWIGWPFAIAGPTQ